MKKIFYPLLLLLALLPAVTACDEESGEINEYANWKARNDAAFATRLDEAKTAIAEARNQYGDAWEDHCDWRILRTYLLPESAEAESTDSIPVQILERGTGSGCPLYTDSVRVNFLVRLLPTELHPEGEIVSHSGYSNEPEDIFSKDFGIPSTLLVSNTIEGFTTAVMSMHIGDRWRVFIPWSLGYGASTASVIPGYSMLEYEIQLKSYYRKGTVPDRWN